MFRNVMFNSQHAGCDIYIFYSARTDLKAQSFRIYQLTHHGGRRMSDDRSERNLQTNITRYFRKLFLFQKTWRRYFWYSVWQRWRDSFCYIWKTRRYVDSDIRVIIRSFITAVCLSISILQSACSFNLKRAWWLTCTILTTVLKQTDWSVIIKAFLSKFWYFHFRVVKNSNGHFPKVMHDSKTPESVFTSAWGFIRIANLQKLCIFLCNYTKQIYMWIFVFILHKFDKLIYF